MNILSDKRIMRFGMTGLATLVFVGVLFVGVPEARAVKLIYSTVATSTFSVPAGVTQIEVKAWGAGGGGGRGVTSGSTGAGGGGGGFAGAVVTSTPSESITIYVGSGGFGATSTTRNGGGGGGHTGIYKGAVPVIVAGAGGGGGGGADATAEDGGGGGGGGGTTGLTGTTGGGGGGAGGAGGTQSGGGAGGNATASTNGENGETDGRSFGGDGADIAGTTGGGAIGGYPRDGGAGGIGGGTNDSGGGGGGGSGYYGGGGGESGPNGTGGEAGGGGGGGSNLVTGTGTQDLQGSTVGAVVTGGDPANTTDPDFDSAAGGGGTGGNAANATAGERGHVVFIYSSSTVIATSTQTASMNSPSTAQYVGGAFVILPDVSSTITSITITENGSVDASTGLDNVTLRYDLDTSAPYDCSDQTYDVGDTQFGSTDTDGFSAANGTATFTGAVLASSTQAMCVYTELDVVAGASGDLEIRLAAASDVVTGGYIQGTFPLDIPDTTTIAAANISISGVCKQWDQTTDCSDTGSVAVAVDGVLQGQTQATVAGTWTISGVSEPGAAGAVITVFIDGAAAASNRAAAVTKWVSGNITGVVLHEGHLTLGSADNQTISNANISQYDNTSGDADVFFDVDASSNLTVDANGSFTNERLLVRQGNTYQPDATGATRIITTQNLRTSSTAVLTANGSTFRLGQDWVNNGTFTAGTSTVEFSGATSSINCSSCTFYNLTASSSVTLTASTSLTVSNTLWSVGTLSIPSGNTVTVPNGTTLTLDGTISGAGTLLYRSTTEFPTTGTISSLLTFDVTSGNQTVSARTYGGAVTIDNSNTVTGRTVTLGSGTVTFSSNLIVGNDSFGDVLLTGVANNPAVNIAGNFFCISGNNDITSGTGIWNASGSFSLTNCRTVTMSTGNTLVMSGTGTLTSAGDTLANLEINSAGTVTLAAATHTVSGNLTLGGAGTPTVTGSTITMTSTTASIIGGGKTLEGLTINPSSAGTITLNIFDLTVSGALEVAAGDMLALASSRTLTHTGATLTLPDTATISGDGTLIYGSTSAFPSTGNASSSLTFDATAGNQIISARSFGGAVKIDNSGATTGRTVTLGTGASQTITFQSGLDIAESGTGDVEVTGSSNNPAISITGNLTCSAGTLNNLTTGSGTWTVSGNVDFTNCNTVTASAGNTLVMGGTGTLTSNGKTLRNLTASGTITFAGAIHTISGNLSLAGGGAITAGASTILMSSTSASIIGGGKTLNHLTIDPSSAGTITLSTSDLNVDGTLNVAANDILSLSSGRTLTITDVGSLTLSGTIAGAGALLYQTGTAFPTTGIISAAITFDVGGGGNQTIEARTFGGNVKIDNSGGISGRTVTLGTGTHVFSGNLDIAESGVGDVNLTGSANSPTVNVTGNLTCSAGTGNTITTGAGTWTVSGTSVDLTNCTLSSTAGTTLVIDGSSPTLTTANQTFGSLNFTGATTPTISGSATSTGNVTFVSGMTLTGVTLGMSSTSATLVGAGNTLPNLTVDGSSASVILGTSDIIISSALAVGADDTLTIASGRTVTTQGTITLPTGGTITGAGRLTITNASGGPGTDGTLSSVVRYDASSASIAAATFDARTYGGAVEIYANSGTAKTVTMNTGTYTFSGGLTITGDGVSDVTLIGTTNSPTVNLTSLAFGGVGDGAKTIAAGSGTWTSTSGNVNFTNGSWSTSAGNTLALSGSGQTLTTASQIFENLNLGSATTPAISGNLTASGTVTFTANTTLTGVTLTMTGQGGNLVGAGNTLPNLTIDGTAASTTIATSDLTVSDSLTVGADDVLNIASGRTLTHTGVSTLTLDGVIQGSGRLTYQSGSAFPTGGTISSILRFDATSNAQSMAARTYGSQVEVVNTGGTSRTVTMATGTTAFSSDLFLYASSTGNITLDGATNQATTTVAGNVDFLGGGGGSEIITAGTRPWTVSGNLDVSGGTFTAPSADLTLAGNYTNTGGTFTHNSGTVTLSGSSQQTLSGTLSDSSAFNNLIVTNNSGTEAAPGVVLNATTTAATSTVATASSSIQFLGGSTFTFSNVNWAGNAANRVFLRSSASGTPWILVVPSTAGATVTYVNAKDSDASNGDTIPAADSTNVNAGGNSNWDFVINSPFVSSTADDVFEVEAASTTIANINFLSGTGSPGGRITSSSDIRARIPASFPAIWDSSVTSVTCADGNACDKMSTTGVTYESSNKIVKMNVLQNFTSSEWVQIAGLKMGNFTAVQLATTTHRLRVDGSGDAIDDATDNRTKTVKGKVTHADHNINQVVNKFDTSGTALTEAELFRFRLTPVGESATITTTTMDIVDLAGFTAGDIVNPRLYEDTNGDGDIDVGEAPLSATGTVSLTGATGTITFGGSWIASAAADIILRADVSSIDDGDTFKLSLSPTNINAKGATTLENLSVSGSSNQVNHGKPRRVFGGGGGSGGGASGGGPPESGSQGGGGQGGGGAGSGGEEPPPGGGQGGGGEGGGEGGSAVIPSSYLATFYAGVTDAMRSLIDTIVNYLGAGTSR